MTRLQEAGLSIRATRRSPVPRGLNGQRGTSWLVQLEGADFNASERAAWRRVCFDRDREVLFVRARGAAYSLDADVPEAPGTRPSYYDVRACTLGSRDMRTINTATSATSGCRSVTQFFYKGTYGCVTLVAMPECVSVFTLGEDPLWSTW